MGQGLHDRNQLSQSRSLQNQRRELVLSAQSIPSPPRLNGPLENMEG